MALQQLQVAGMGGQVNVVLDTVRDGGEAAVAAAARRVLDFEKVLSRFDPESELSRLNGQLNSWVRVSKVLFEIILAARHAYDITDGLFNPLVLDALNAWGYDGPQLGDVDVVANPVIPLSAEVGLAIDETRQSVMLGSPIDLGGIAKGWVADTVASDLAHLGRCLVNVCGDLSARDYAEIGESWNVELGPWCPASPRRIRVPRTMGVATSGVGKRRWRVANGQAHHIIDPRTGAPAATDVLAATVLHRSAMVAEVFATAAVVLGSRRAISWLNSWESCAGCVTLADGRWLATANFWLIAGQAE